MKKIDQLAITLAFALLLVGCEDANIPINANANQVVLNQNINTITQLVNQDAHQAATVINKSAGNDFYSVVKVVDGDTVDVNLNGTVERIRLIGINTPETVDPRKPVECFGVEASNKAKAVLAGQSVRLENDFSQGDKDKYNRLLRYIFLTDGTNFNKMMIEQGFAYEYTYNLPYKYQQEFKQAQKDAEAKKLGLWQDNICQTTTALATTSSANQNINMNLNSNTNAVSVGCVIKGNISSGGKIYHLPGCGSYDKTVIDVAAGERWFCTEAEAVAAGWRKAKNCPQ